MDKELIKLYQENLVKHSVVLDGVHALLNILETRLWNVKSTQNPPIVLTFSNSELLKQYRTSNDEKTMPHRGEDTFNIGAISKILLESARPSASMFKSEGSGSAEVARFLQKAQAQFNVIAKTPADFNTLSGLPTNLLRVASDMFWADLIRTYLDKTGKLVQGKVAEFEAKLESMLQTRVVNIPDHVLQPLFSFMHYCILSSFHLNMLADPKLVEPEDVRVNSLKRKRIILRMAKGYTGTKKRRFV